MQTVTLARHAMATRFELVLHGNDPVALRAAGEAALDEVTRAESQLSLYRPGSEIAQVNARAAREAVHISPELFALLEQAQRLHAETQGAFDITVAPLVRCWGFMDNRGKMPSPEALADARTKVGMTLVQARPTSALSPRGREDAVMHAELREPARLQYWSAAREADPRDAIAFDTLADAVAFAMTQNPGNKELAWATTASGETLTPSQIASLWELTKAS